MPAASAVRAPTPSATRAPACSAIQPTIGAPRGAEPTNTIDIIASTRPRMAGAALSCTRLLEPEFTSIVVMPTGTVASAARATVGATASRALAPASATAVSAR